MENKVEDLFNDSNAPATTAKNKAKGYINLDVEMADGTKKRLGSLTLWNNDKNQLMDQLVEGVLGGKVDVNKLKISVNSINSATPKVLEEQTFAQ